MVQGTMLSFPVVGVLEEVVPCSICCVHTYTVEHVCSNGYQVTCVKPGLGAICVNPGLGAGDLDTGLGAGDLVTCCCIITGCPGKKLIQFKCVTINDRISCFDFVRFY